MFESEHERQAPETEDSGSGTETPTGEDIGSKGGEGTQNAEATPAIADDAEHEQTQVPAPDDDVKPNPEEPEGDEPADDA